MANTLKKLMLALMVLLLSSNSVFAGSFWDIFKPKRSTEGSSSPSHSSTSSTFPSENEMVLAVKDALGQGIDRAVRQLGREGGFLSNVNVRIPIPDSLREVEKTLRWMKQDRLVDDFVITMNGAAESAVPQAAPVFVDALKAMTVQDVKQLIEGPEDSLTGYFRSKTESRLAELILPSVKKATAESGATKVYKDILSRGEPLMKYVPKTTSLDLDAYVTQKTLDGIFYMIAAEEKRIRENPQARTTELLQKVFDQMVGRK